MVTANILALVFEQSGSLGLYYCLLQSHFLLLPKAGDRHQKYELPSFEPLDQISDIRVDWRIYAV